MSKKYNVFMVIAGGFLILVWGIDSLTNSAAKPTLEEELERKAFLGRYMPPYKLFESKGYVDAINGLESVNRIFLFKLEKANTTKVFEEIIKASDTFKAALKLIEQNANSFPKSKILGNAAVNLNILIDSLEKRKNVESAWQNVEKDKAIISELHFVLPGNSRAKNLFFATVEALGTVVRKY